MHIFHLPDREEYECDRALSNAGGGREREWEAPKDCVEARTGVGREAENQAKSQPLHDSRQRSCFGIVC